MRAAALQRERLQADRGVVAARTARVALAAPSWPPIGARHSTCVSRAAGAASMFVGLQTAPSTYSPRRCAPAGRPTGCCTTPARPAPRSPPARPGRRTRRVVPRSRSTHRSADVRPSCSPWPAMRAPRSSSERSGASMRASAAARTSAPACARATARWGRVRCRRRSRGRRRGGPRAARAAPFPAASPSLPARRRRGEQRALAAARRRAATRSPRPHAARVGGRPRLDAREQVGGDHRAGRRSDDVLAGGEVDPRLRAIAASTPPIQAAPTVPPAPSTSTSGRCIARRVVGPGRRNACT